MVDFIGGTIEGVAMVNDRNHVIAKAKPARHNDLINFMTQELGYTPETIAEYTQGFYTNKHEFVGRKMAYRIAQENNLIKGVPIHDSELFSEDLW